MAKVTAAATDDTTEGTATPARAGKPGPVVVVSARTRKLIDAVTEQFKSYASARITLGQTASKLAPKFMQAFDAWHTETAGKFIEFVHLVDPSVPMQRELYRANGTYQAADYLRRLVALSEAEPSTPRDPNAPKPVSPLEAIARLITTIAPLVDNVDIIWEAFLKELHWSDNQVSRVRKLVAKGNAPAILMQHGAKLKLIRRAS